MDTFNTQLFSLAAINKEQIGSAGDCAMAFQLDGFGNFLNLATFSFTLKSGETCYAHLKLDGFGAVSREDGNPIKSKADYLDAIASGEKLNEVPCWLSTTFFVANQSSESLAFARERFNNEMQQYFDSIQEAVEFFYDDVKMLGLSNLIESSIACYRAAS